MASHQNWVILCSSSALTPSRECPIMEDRGTKITETTPPPRACCPTLLLPPPCSFRHPGHTVKGTVPRFWNFKLCSCSELNTPNTARVKKWSFLNQNGMPCNRLWHYTRQPTDMQAGVDGSRAEVVRTCLFIHSAPPPHPPPEKLPKIVFPPSWRPEPMLTGHCFQRASADSGSVPQTSSTVLL